jgi:hypothetical protein
MKWLKFIGFDSNVTSNVKIGEKEIEEVSVAYERGRLTVYINNKEVYGSVIVGNDFQIDIVDKMEK